MIALYIVLAVIGGFLLGAAYMYVRSALLLSNLTKGDLILDCREMGNEKVELKMDVPYDDVVSRHLIALRVKYYPVGSNSINIKQ